MRFCEHIWEITGEGFNPGLVDYGGVIVYGTHVLWRCSKCGKKHYKVDKHSKYHVYNRGECEEYMYNRFSKQMEFI